MRFISSILITCSAQGDEYQLIWSDEFDGQGAIDTNKWHHQTQLPNGSSWYNGEIQHYTNRADNSYVSNGTLKIVARKETFSDQGVTLTHTSARLNSKFAFTYGYVEIRAQLPTGVGTWPAMWTLGQNITEPGGFWEPTHGTTSWPYCGEIDIMEHWGSNQNYVQSAMHTPSSFGNTVNKGGQTISTASSAFHVYALEWTPERMVFSVDGNVHYIYEPAVQNGETWPFDANQYILLNVAVLPDILPSFTQSILEIDYVRVFQNPALSIDEALLTNAIQLFPNPVIDTMNVEIPNVLLGAKAKLHSMNGKILFDTSIDSTTNAFDFSNFKTGIYLLTIEKEGRRFIKKIIKQ